MESFSTPQAAVLADCSFRQLDAWAREGLVSPRRDVPGAGGPGYWRKWSVRDVVVAALLGCAPEEHRREVADRLGALAELPTDLRLRRGWCELRLDVAGAEAEIRRRIAGPTLPRIVTFAS